MKTALVTGGNKGIGFAACRGLAEKGFHVFLGSRDAERGRHACEKLHQAGYQEVTLLEIDVSNMHSIETAAKKLMSQTDSVHALVNNAGVYLDRSATGLTVSPQIILETFNTNTLGALLLTRELVPLLEKAKGAEVINVSSGMGQLEDMGGDSAAYRISKTSLNAVTRILAHELAEKKIHVNSICPGWVKTEMGGDSAPRTVEQGADTIVWLATGEGKASGGFFRDRKKISW